jgi:hypothetical protein
MTHHSRYRILFYLSQEIENGVIDRRGVAVQGMSRLMPPWIFAYRAEMSGPFFRFRAIEAAFGCSIIREREMSPRGGGTHRPFLRDGILDQQGVSDQN